MQSGDGIFVGGVFYELQNEVRARSGNCIPCNNMHKDG